MAFDPNATWTVPDYAGTDPAYAAWLAGARTTGTDAISAARMRQSQLDDAKRQALQDLDTRAVTGRRTIQSNMLGRGMFGSGEMNRQQQEYDSQIEQGRSRANQAYIDNVGQNDLAEQSALHNLGAQGATQVSQAMLRDALAAYDAQQKAATTAAASAPIWQQQQTPDASQAPPPTMQPTAPTPNPYQGQQPTPYMPPRPTYAPPRPMYAPPRPTNPAPPPQAPMLTPLHGRF